MCKLTTELKNEECLGNSLLFCACVLAGVLLSLDGAHLYLPIAAFKRIFF